MIDQAVWRRPGSDEQGLNVFLRLGGAPSDRNFLSFYADAGIGFRAPFVSRPDDVVTLGGAFGHVSAEALRAERLAGSPISASDYAAVIELSYKAAMVPGWTVQPDLQYVIQSRPECRRFRPSRGDPERADPGLADHADWRSWLSSRPLSLRGARDKAISARDIPAEAAR